MSTSDQSPSRKESPCLPAVGEAVEHWAFLYSDGSVGLALAGASREDAERELARDADPTTLLARVSLTVNAVVWQIPSSTAMDILRRVRDMPAIGETMRAELDAVLARGGP